MGFVHPSLAFPLCGKAMIHYTGSNYTMVWYTYEYALAKGQSLTLALRAREYQGRQRYSSVEREYWVISLQFEEQDTQSPYAPKEKLQTSVMFNPDVILKNKK